MTTHLQEMLEKRLAALVALPTVTHDVQVNREAIHGIARELEHLGMYVHIDGPRHPWVIATTRKTKHPKVLLAAHIDIVEPNSPDQYTMYIKDGNIYGRGTFDMKFALAGYLELAKQLAAAGTLHEYDFGILITSDEEKGGYDGTKHWLEQGWRADVALIPDGGRDWKIEERAKGVTYIYLTATGAATHSSRPWEGQNAAHSLLLGLQEIMKAFPNDDPDGATLSINVVETAGAGRHNVTQVPNHAKASIDARAFTTEEMNRVKQRVLQIAEKYALQVDITLDEPGVSLDKTNPLVQQFIACLAQVREQPVEFTDAYGASDARHLAVYSIPSLLLYPHGGGAHSATEWIARQDLSTFYHLIEAYLDQAAHDPENAEPPMTRRLNKYKRLLVKIRPNNTSIAK